MTDQSAHFISRGRLAACIAAAGLLFAPAALAQTQLPSPNYGQADVRQDRIEELESQIRDATAENERLQYELSQAQREITRLNALIGELSSVNQSLATQPETQPAPPPQPHRQTNSNQTGATTPQQTGSLGTLNASQLPGEAGPAYSRARELLVGGRYAEAEVAFRDFLTQFPDAETAADARYWFGFTLLARNNYPDAAGAFVDYLERAPQGVRAPEAQVRLGMALIGMGQARQGCAAFSALPRRYPNASRAVRDLAAREARASNCAA